jgi:cell wall-associated NlpC family hydrolase
MSAPVSTAALKELVPDQTTSSGLITNTSSNQLRALMDNPDQVTGGQPTPVGNTSGQAGTTSQHVPNPYGLGITAYEPNTSPYIHQLADSKTAVGSPTLKSVEGDYADASARVGQSMSDAAAAAAANTVNPLGDFASGGVIDASGKVAAFINAALGAASRGVPYVWGGTNLNAGVDCSGLIYAAAQAAGITDWKRYSAASYGAMPQVAAAAARPGDIVYWAPGQNGAGPTGHVGIYIGNGKIIAAPQSGETVKVQSIFGAPTFHRIFDDAAFGTVNTPGGGYTYNYNGRASSWETQASQAVVSGALSTVGRSLGSLLGHSSVPSGQYTPEATYSPSPRSGLKVAVPYANLFTSAGAKYGVSPALLAAVAKNESSFSPVAHSNAGAIGLMQFMPGTAAGLGINPLDPAQAVDGAARMLLGLYRQFGSWNLALAAYNAGAGNVRKGVIPGETSRYVNAVLSTAAQYGG